MKKILLVLLLFTLNTFAQTIRKPGENYSIPVEPGAGKPDPDLEIIRKRVVADLLDPAVSKDVIDRLTATQKPDGTWPGINYEDVSNTGFQHSEHLGNMLVLARAFKKPGSAFEGNASVKKAVSTALNYWIDHDFICQNWWWNEMGTPHLMINILLVLDTDLSERQRKEGVRIAGRANLEASGARPGGDLIQIAGMLGKQALFQKNAEVLAKVIAVMASEIRVSTGRGMKPDLSFHHRTDNVISTLAYGTGYASAFAYWAVKIAGTKYTLPEPAMKLLVDYYLDGVCPALIYGIYIDPGAENRGITRRNALHAVGAELPENLMAATSYRKPELENIVKIRKGEVKPDLTRDTYFWHSHYYTHQRPNFYASVRMHSKRANNMEQPHNEEGLKNHHYGDGSNFISRTGREYNQIFPVWDWQKIPGTTVVQKPDVAHWKELAKPGINAFTGGVTDKRYGAAAFDFASVHDPLKAKKAWFFFDKEFVSLGAGISSESDYKVATTLNQSLLNKSVIVNAANKTQTLATGKHELSKVSWVLHDSVAYIFPEPVGIHLNNDVSTGNWRSINHQAWATSDPVKENVFTLWLDHGVKPRNASYQYIVVPNLLSGSIPAYNKQADVKIISNTVEIQAVQHKGLGITQVVFYKPGRIKISDATTITADSPCLVMVRIKGKTVEQIAVSDPTEQLKSLQLEITAEIKGSGPQWETTWNAGKKMSALKFNLPQEGMAGQSVIAEMPLK